MGVNMERISGLIITFDYAIIRDMANKFRVKRILVLLHFGGASGRDILSGILDAIKPGMHWHTRILSGADFGDAERLLDGIDGVITSERGSATFRAALEKARVPTVVIGQAEEDFSSHAAPMAFVHNNDTSIGQKACRYFLSLGDFRYYNGGDFSWRVKTPAGAFADIEDFHAPECPEVDVANANHHGHHSMTDALVKALRARVVVTGVWHQEHMNRPTMRRLAKATWPCLYAPGLFPEKRRQKDAAEPWLKDVAPESFTGAHVVVDVAPDGKKYRLMMVSAADETRRILGAYDFETSRK